MKRNMLLTMACALAAAVAGCLDFDEQKVYGEYDAKADQLLFVIDYQGFYEQEGRGEPATNQLDEALKNEGWALFGNWPFSGYLKEMREELAAPPAEGDETPPELRKDFLAILQRIKVLQGGFYTDARDRICGAQVITIEKASETIPMVNRLINAAILHAAQNEPPEDEQATMAVELAKKGHVWVALKGHSLIVSGPVPEELVAEGRGEVASGLVGSDYASDILAVQAFKDMLANPVFVWHEDSMLRLKIGLEGQPWHCVTKLAHGKYEPSLVDGIKQEYGLRLEENLVKYLENPDAAAQSEAEQAAKLIAPRLGKPQLVCVLVRALKKKPTEAIKARLRAVPLKPEVQQEGDLNDEQRLTAWEGWLKALAAPPEPEKE